MAQQCVKVSSPLCNGKGFAEKIQPKSMGNETEVQHDDQTAKFTRRCPKPCQPRTGRKAFCLKGSDLRRNEKEGGVKK